MPGKDDEDLAERTTMLRKNVSKKEGMTERDDDDKIEGEVRRKKEDEEIFPRVWFNPSVSRHRDRAPQWTQVEKKRREEKKKKTF